MSSDGNASVTASIYSELGSLPELSNFKTTKNGEKLSALSSYYFSLNQGDAKSLKNLYFKGDGSREWFVKHEKKHPKKYEGGENYIKVSVLRAYSWGDYSIFYVERTRNNSNVMQWVDVTVCPNSDCFISNLLFQPDSATDIASAVMYQANTGQIIKKNTSYDINFDVFPPSGSRYPITIYIDIVESPGEQLFPRKNDSDGNVYLSNYFNALHNIKKSQDDGELSAEELSTKLAELNQKVWSSYDKQNAHRQYAVASSSFESKYFSDFAYLSFLTSFDSISVAGKIVLQNDEYLLLKAVSGDKVQPLLFLVNNSGRPKQKIENVALRQLLMSDQAIEALADWIRK
jgi:hypothetical protein